MAFTWRETKPQVLPFPFYDIYVLVLHVLQVCGPDVAVDHEHDHLPQIWGNFHAATLFSSSVVTLEYMVVEERYS